MLRALVEHLAGLRVARQQLGVSGDPADADEGREQQPGCAGRGDARQTAHDSTGASSAGWVLAPKPATSSAPTTAAPKASATITETRCAVGEGLLRRGQHHGHKHRRPEQFSPHWREGTGCRELSPATSVFLVVDSNPRSKFLL